MIQFRWAGGTDRGVTRSENQDSVLPAGVDQGINGVVAVADGLGGHPGGDIASTAAIEAVAATPVGLDGQALVTAAHDGIMARILEAIESQPDLIAMATTLTVAVLRPDGVEIAHVGDSRAYVFDGSRLTQITEDHTHGMDSVRAGEALIEDVQTSPDWHVLNNWLGFESYRVATHRVPTVVGNRFLLCTDGLSNMLSDFEIAELVKTGEPEGVVESLIAAANEAGGKDNISAVVAEVVES